MVCVDLGFFSFFVLNLFLWVGFRRSNKLDRLMFTDYVNGLLTGFYLAIVFGALLIGWLCLVLQEQQQQQQLSVPALPIARCLSDAREKKLTQPQNRSAAVLIP